MLQVLIFTGLLLQASASQITGLGSTTADYGGDAHYKCTVSNPTGVLQVTWQRLFSDESIENLATYSKRFGQQVNEPYKGKVIFTEASLTSTSITLKNVTWDDDSCYICSFNVYPDGSKRKQTCLTVEGLSEVKTAVHPPISEHEEKDLTEVVFSCSATGKPAPTIKWDISGGAADLGKPHITIETNSDHTFTTRSNTTLRVPPDWNGHVDCLLNSGMRGERRESIPFAVRAGNGNEKTEEGKGLSHSGIALIVSALIIISCAAVAAAVKRKGSKSLLFSPPGWLKGSRRDVDVDAEDV